MDDLKWIIILLLIIIGVMIFNMGLNFGEDLFGGSEVFKPSLEDGDVFISDGSRMTPGTKNPNVLTAAGLAADSTTSTTYVDIDDMSLTIVNDGTYLIIFNAAVMIQTSAGVSCEGDIEILNNAASVVTGKVGFWNNHALGIRGVQQIVSLTAVETLSAGDVIKVRWQVQDANGEFFNFSDGTKFRTLSIVRIN